MNQLQNIFNAVWERAKDKRKSVDVRPGQTGRCLYRGASGLKCFAGVLIPDDKYDPSMEGLGASSVKYLWDTYPAADEQRLIRRLQGIHDSENVAAWETDLRNTALVYGLKVPQ